jgi:ligand-binding SRPBCC domain-containing protein
VPHSTVTIAPRADAAGRGWRLRAVQRIPRPVEDVFPFFADAHNLEAITPEVLRFRILTPAPIEMRPGTLIDYAIKVRGVPIRWRTEIPVWEPPVRFVDNQIRGPYALWRHEHLFEPDGDATVMTDTVDYRPRGGPLAPVVHALFVRRDLQAIFEHRARVIAERFGG